MRHALGRRPACSVRRADDAGIGALWTLWASCADGAAGTR
jgi:hypothetical protein